MVIDRPRMAVTACGFCAFLSLYAPQAVLPQLTETFHITPAEAGATVSVSTLAVALAAPLLGLLTERWNRKTTIVGSALLLLIPTILLVLSGSLNEIMVWRFCQGIFLPSIFSTAVAYTSEEWQPAEAADIMGLYIAGSALGGFSGRFVTALMAEHFGWRAGFMALAVVTLACAVLIWAWLPAPRSKPQAQAQTKGMLWQHLKNPGLQATCAAGFAVLFSMVAAFTYINFHLAAAPYFLGPAQLGMIFMVYLIGAAVSPLSGALIRRLGRRWSMQVAVAISVFGMALTLHPALPVILAGLALFVTGIFLAQSMAMGFVGQTIKVGKGTALGIYLFCYYVGGSVGGVLPGWLVWHKGGWAGCVVLVMLTIATAGLLAWRAWAPKPAGCGAACSCAAE